jgi:hypothetical protein
MDEVQKALKERYKHIHPLLFHRSMERAETDSELFDLLDGMPDLPVVWDEEDKVWKHAEDLLQQKGFYDDGDNVDGPVGPVS